MSAPASSTSSPLKVFLGALGVFVFFGFLALILSGYAGHESMEDRAYMGEFDAETIQQRWDNLDEIEAAQEELFNEEKVDTALAALLKDAPKAAKSDVVVPGSPTFMKQMEEASAPEEAPAEEGAAAPADDMPAESEADEPAAPKEEKPSAPKEKEKAPAMKKAETSEKPAAGPAEKAKETPGKEKPAEEKKPAPSGEAAQ